MVKMNMSDIDISEPLSDMLAPLNNEQKEFLMNNYTIQTYKKNETIYCEGETPSHLMCLINGKVKIFKDGVGGRSQIIRMIKPHEYFAYRAYFAQEDFVTAAAAFEPSVVCLIPMSAIMTLVAQNNDLAMFFIRQLSIDLGISDERTVSLTQKHIRGRLAESLIFLKESYGLVHELYCECDFGMVASLTNISLVPYEMIAAGLPVIEFKDGTFDYFFSKETAILCDLSYKHLEKEILYYVENPAELEEMTIRANKSILSLSWEKSANQFVEILDHVDTVE